MTYFGLGADERIGVLLILLFLISSFLVEKRNMQVMKEDLGKLKHELQSQKELAAQTEKDKETPGHNFEGEKSLVIKEESMDWHLDSLTNLVGPKVNDFEVHDTIEKIGSTSEIIKVTYLPYNRDLYGSYYVKFITFNEVEMLSSNVHVMLYV